MVSLARVQSSNSLISSTLPPNLVAVFVGATSGIGEATLKQFAIHSHKPRVYFVGRSQDAANRIADECKALNSDGEYIFIKADVSLIRVVDTVCEEIKAKEKAINILFLSAGFPSMDGTGNNFQVSCTSSAEKMIFMLTTGHRNGRASPLADGLDLLLPLSLHDQLASFTSTRSRSPPRHYCWRRRSRRPVGF